MNSVSYRVLAASSRSNSTLAVTVVVTVAVAVACCAVGMEKVVVLLFLKDIRTTFVDF
jgi:hypothetical protein